MVAPPKKPAGLQIKPGKEEPAASQQQTPKNSSSKAVAPKEEAKKPAAPSKPVANGPGAKKATDLNDDPIEAAMQLRIKAGGPTQVVSAADAKKLANVPMPKQPAAKPVGAQPKPAAPAKAVVKAEEKKEEKKVEEKKQPATGAKLPKNIQPAKEEAKKPTTAAPKTSLSNEPKIMKGKKKNDEEVEAD